MLLSTLSYLGANQYCTAGLSMLDNLNFGIGMEYLRGSLHGLLLCCQLQQPGLNRLGSLQMC